jgi:hypothetical protein
LGHFEFFSNSGRLFADQDARPVSTTPGVNFATSTPSVIDIGVNNIRGKLPPLSTTPEVTLPRVSMTPVANNVDNIRLLTPQYELEGKNMNICSNLLPKSIQTK